MAVAACIVLLWPTAWGHVGVIAVAAVAGLLLFKPAEAVAHDPLPMTISRRVGIVLLGLFFALLVGLPILAQVWPSQTWR